METEETKRKSSAKNSRKGGKQNKTLTAEEEARRREEIRERLREKLELERRALKVVERLLDESVTEDFLVDCAKFITAANYKDTIEERFIAKLCGYPICPNKLGKIPTQQYKISTKTNKVYDITERKCFCCNFCYKASKEFELQISKTPLWLRQHESPEEIKLLKKGDSGSFGEEVKLTERPLKEEDIENPPAPPPADPHSSQQPLREAGLSDLSDGEEEQDFVSSVVSGQQRPRVHWGDLPNRTDEGKSVGQTGRRKKQVCEEDTQQEGDRAKEVVKTEAEKVKQQHRKPPDQAEEPGVDEVTAQIDSCRLSETVAHDAPPPADTRPTHAGHIPASLPELTNPPSNDGRNDSASPNQPDLSITQVGMSRRGAAGLRDLLKNHQGAKPDSLRLSLLEYLKRTLQDWRTAETLTFLYGDSRPLGSPLADVKKEEEKVEEELDEDDLEDEVTAVSDKEAERPSAAAPDYETLRRDTEQLEHKVKEFYKGSRILPEEVNGGKLTVQEQSVRDASLPLTDSQAQHVIQKRITVEKLTSCLRNIVGPLRLTMSDVSTHLNNLVRTFRLTNTNIIHKTPQWTLIAVVLLHLLSEVSMVVREALETSASVEYLNTLMEELGLREQDLLNLVQLFKCPTQ